VKRLVSVLIALAVASPAWAADLSITPIYKAPVALPSPAYSWTGFYIGGNGGYGWSCGQNRSQNDPNIIGDPINGRPDGFGNIDRNVPLPFGDCAGGLGGFQLGYNQQIGSLFVVGAEVDFDATNIKGTANSLTNAPGGAGGIFSVGPTLTVCGAGCQGTRTEEVSLRWISTARIRVGVPFSDELFVPGASCSRPGAPEYDSSFCVGKRKARAAAAAHESRILVYGTGGFAFGDVSTNGSVNIVPPALLASSWSGSSSTTKTGYTVGGGVEYAILNNWTIGAEYLYFDLGPVSHTLNLTSCSAPAAGCFPTLGTVSDKVNGNIVRGALSYKF